MPVLAALLAVLPFITLAKAGLVSWDDPSVIVLNPLLRLDWPAFLAAAPVAHPLAAWQPVGWILYRVLYGLGGASPAPYHLAGLALHALNAGLLCAWLAETAKAKSAPARAACALAAVLWAWHPVQAESVAWAAALSDLLCASFVLAGLHQRERGRAARGLALFALAGLCRWKALAYPVLCVMRDGGKKKRDWPALALISAGVLASTAAAKSAGGYSAVLKPHEAAAGLLWQWSKLAWPSRLAPGALFTPSENPLGLGLAAAVLLLAALIAAHAYLWKRAPGLARAGAAFTACLLPTVLAGPPKQMFLYDHHLYLPLAAFAVPLAAWLAAKPARAAWAAALLVPLGLAGAAQARAWTDSEALWTRTLEAYPRSMTATNHLIELYADSGRHAEALVLVDRQLARSPGYAFLVGLRGALLENVAPTPAKRAVLNRAAAGVLFKRGDAAGGAGYLDGALKDAPRDADVLTDAAVAADALGDRPKARALLDRALRADPRHARARAASDILPPR